jgi:hypothetical protein
MKPGGITRPYMNVNNVEYLMCTAVIFDPESYSLAVSALGGTLSVRIRAATAA